MLFGPDTSLTKQGGFTPPPAQGTGGNTGGSVIIPPHNPKKHIKKPEDFNPKDWDKFKQQEFLCVTESSELICRESGSTSVSSQGDYPKGSWPISLTNLLEVHSHHGEHSLILGPDVKPPFRIRTRKPMLKINLCFSSKEVRWPRNSFNNSISWHLLQDIQTLIKMMSSLICHRMPSKPMSLIWFIHNQHFPGVIKPGRHKSLL